VDHLINPVLQPIRNLINAVHPKPKELPQNKPRVENLQTDVKRLMK
jgi:hypothetical protein